MNNIAVLFKSNELIKTRHSLTVEENRVLEKIFLEIQKQKNNIILISKEEIDEILSNKNYKTKEGFKEFFDKMVKNRVEIKQGKSWALIALLSSVVFEEKTLEYKIEVPKTLLDFMTEYTKKGYTPINVTKYVSINKSNAQRLYELLRMWTGSKKVIEYKVQEIREYLMLENKYKAFDNFRRRIIEPTIEELRKKELLDIYKVEYIKKGRSIDSIKFHVKDLEDRNYDFNSKNNDSKVEEKKQEKAPEATEEQQKQEDTTEIKFENNIKKENDDIEIQLRILKMLHDVDATNITETHIEKFADRFGNKIVFKVANKIVEDLIFGQLKLEYIIQEFIKRATKLQEKEQATITTEVIKEQAITAIQTTTEALAPEAPREEINLDNIEKEVKKDRNFDVVIADITRNLKNNSIFIDAVEIAKLKEKYSEILLNNAVNILIKNNAEKKISNHLNYLNSILENIKNDSTVKGAKESNNNSSKPSGFANFTQREYDYNKLEKQLLGWDDGEYDKDDNCEI